ncbi:MAG: hypothetical protein JNL70_10775 [Saprospiraceae bacterium]|nr:hypothetical protein [Saprospiraceae bacterium]
MGHWRTLHLFDDKKFYKEVVPALKGESGNLTTDCLEFLESHVTGGIRHLSQPDINNLVEQTIRKINSISNSLDKTFKTNCEYQKNKDYDSEILFLNDLDGYYEFCKFFEYYIFKTCSDFLPHLPLGKGGVSRNFDINIKTLSYSILGDLDSWNEFLCGYGMGITNWLTNIDVEYLYLDKENLYFKDNEIAIGFLTLLEVAHYNELGFIAGVDMREERLELLPNNKLLKPEVWTNINTIGLLWKR